MNILYDLRTTNYYGVFKYGLQLLKEIVTVCAKDDFLVILVPEKTFMPVQKSENVIFVYTHKINSPLDIYFSDINPIINHYKCDIYYSPNYIFNCNIHIKAVFTIHDLIGLKHTYGYSNGEYKARFGKNCFKKLKTFFENSVMVSSDSYYKAALNKITEDCIAKCSHIITVSDFSKKEIEHHFNSKQKKISIIRPSYENRDNTTSHGKQQNSFEKKIFLIVGQNKSHKRITWLLNFIIKNHGLFIIGVEFWFVSKDPSQFIFESNYIKRNLIDNVKFIFDVPESHLKHLYGKATALIAASTIEGFCMPILEALCNGTEVICTDIEVFRETSKDCAFFFKDEKELLKHINQIGLGLVDKKSLSFKERNNWKKSAMDLYKILQENVGIEK